MQIIKIKRTTTPNNPPLTLAEGELCLGLGDTPKKVWVGTASGVQELLAGGGGVIVSATAPTGVPDNTLWWDSDGGRLYLLYNDGNSVQWVDAAPSMQGPQGEQGFAGQIASVTTTVTDPGTPPEVIAGGTPEVRTLEFELPATQTFEVGDVDASLPGAEAEVTITGTPTERLLNFTFPRGIQGPPGEIIPAVPDCGLLRTGAPGAGASNTLRFVPFRGNWVRINGVMHEIPPGGVEQIGLDNAWANGVPPGLALGANSVYLVYLFDDNGTLRFDFWWRGQPGAGHSMSTTPGNYGTEIRTGDDTRTLVGIVWTNNATNAFWDEPRSRQVRSWFNRQRMIINGGHQTISGGTAAVWFNRGANVNVVHFSDEPLFLTMNTGMQIDTVGTHYARLSEGGAAGIGSTAVATVTAAWWATYPSTYSETTTADMGRTFNCMTYHIGTLQAGNTIIQGTLG